MSIKDELLSLRDDQDMIYPHVVVDWARQHEDSSLYRSIEWNNSIAADNYRVWQVRQLLKVHVVNDDKTPRVLSLSIDRVSGGGYRTVESILSRRDLTNIMVLDAIAELERVKKRYNSIKKLSKVWDELEVVKSENKKATNGSFDLNQGVCS